MVDPKGFLKVRTRHELAERPVAERLKDWRDVHQSTGPGPWTAEQAARCMDCGTPFCMTGCPLGNLIPEFNDLLSRGRWEEAYERLSLTNNFPEFTGRICPAPCESSCVLSIHQPATTIKLDEQTIIDQAWSLGLVKPRPPQRLTDMTVAVVGSGPAGLACAQQLTRAGHTVVVYERADAIGGLLRYGIPAFKLEKSLLDRRLEQMEAEGTRFRTGVEIGRELGWDQLRARYDALVVAIGSTEPRRVDLPGRELKGIHYAMDFLPDPTRKLMGREPINDIDACDKNVIIIGGGDTGSDCLGTALREGAKSVTVLQIRPREPSSRPDNRPWPTYARLYNPTSSMEEGGHYEYAVDSLEYLGAGADDRINLDQTSAPTGFDRDDEGRVRGVRVVDVSRDDQDRIIPHPDTERVLPADLVLISIGFAHPETVTLTGQTGVGLDPRGNVARDADYATDRDGIFVCGDAGRGQSLVVWALAEGRSCAAAVDRYLTGATELPAPIRADERAMTLPAADRCPR